MSESTRPTVPEMLSQLEAAYKTLTLLERPQPALTLILEMVLSDFHWYAKRLGPTRWEVSPRPGKWSYAENLWHITEQALAQAEADEPLSVLYHIDHGKEHVGLAAELLAIFSYDEQITL